MEGGERGQASGPASLGDQARRIWQAAVDAARPGPLVSAAVAEPALQSALAAARQIIVVGAGKAGAAMSAALEACLPSALDRVEGSVNVPQSAVRPLRAIQLHAGRPPGSNEPTDEGVAGTRRMLELVAGAGPEDVVVCLLSGGGSALMPSPVEGVTLADKRAVTRLLHASGATIHEMNAVRKHLSRCKGGTLAARFRGRAWFSLIISDVVGDALDVIASGPSAPDPTTFGDALAVLEKYTLRDRVPAPVLQHLRRGQAKEIPETPKVLPANIHNRIIGNNAHSLAAAETAAAREGFAVLNLGAFIEGETRDVAFTLAGIVRSVRAHGRPCAAPVCILSGGETTVTLSPGHGLGGRNQEFVLACLINLGAGGLRDVVVLSGGTDGEDGPTDAAGAVADVDTVRRAAQRSLNASEYLGRHDAYRFFDLTGDLIRTGLTETNVMDVRVILVR
jgi:hydroxypyruvate reductase/glycerate 2-kinase